jgi:hypothetical protein
MISNSLSGGKYETVGAVSFLVVTRADFKPLATFLELAARGERTSELGAQVCTCNQMDAKGAMNGSLVQTLHNDQTEFIEQFIVPSPHLGPTASVDRYRCQKPNTVCGCVHAKPTLREH